MNDEDNLIFERIDNLIQSSTRPQELQVCPICGGDLHIGFAAYQRFREDLFGANLDCTSGGIGMAVGYAGPLPAWLIAK
jgi:hypothetical protein